MQGAQEADDSLLPSIPAKPVVSRSRLYRLADVVRPGRRRRRGVGAKLVTMAERRSAPAALAALDADTVRCLRHMTYKGGSSDPPLARSQAYDLRFLGDRLMVCPPASATAVAELPYDDVETVEVSGSDHGKSLGEQLAMILGLGLVGAVLARVLAGGRPALARGVRAPQGEGHRSALAGGPASRRRCCSARRGPAPPAWPDRIRPRAGPPGLPNRSSAPGSP